MSGLHQADKIVTSAGAASRSSETYQMEAPMFRFHAAFACGAAIALATPASAEDLCAKARTALGPAAAGLACVGTSAGVALAADMDRAAQLSRLGEAGEGRFRAHFGRDAPLYIILEAVELDGVPDPRAELQGAGFARALIWFTHADYVRQVTTASRTSAEAAARRQGLDEQTASAAGDRAVAARRLGRLELDAREAQVVPHELGHGWFISAFWPGHQGVAQGHYGGPGPDWLDEISAMLMESGDGAEERRKVFRDAYQGRGSGALATYPVAHLIDLPRFLSREHPAQSRPDIRPTESSPAGGVTMRVITSSDQAALASVAEAAMYYPQGRMFADFLLDRTGDPLVFKTIAEGLAEGQNFEGWLAANGSARDLPGSLAELDAAWREWLNARFGPPLSKSPQSGN
ncbi:hypothetical protein [Brevundimonas sp.]|uniref:hypothetical protein n=1 Tax=Brevundimonas sp. TaxID=1871086 RepID=UPI0035B27E7E